MLPLPKEPGTAFSVCRNKFFLHLTPAPEMAFLRANSTAMNQLHNGMYLLVLFGKCCRCGEMSSGRFLHAMKKGDTNEPTYTARFLSWDKRTVKKQSWSIFSLQYESPPSDYWSRSHACSVCRSVDSIILNRASRVIRKSNTESTWSRYWSSTLHKESSYLS